MTCPRRQHANPVGMNFCGRCATRTLLASSDRQQAQQRLTIATVIDREMDMRFWLEQAEADRET